MEGSSNHLDLLVGTHSYTSRNAQTLGTAIVSTVQFCLIIPCLLATRTRIERQHVWRKQLKETKDFFDPDRLLAMS